jgi:hypothetical protein
MKKFVMLIGGLIFAFLVAVISIPFFVDVDKYRPQILEAVNSKVNGKVELGKLTLSLWGAIKVNAESINVAVNGFEKPLLQAKEFKFEIPFHSILTGPEIIAAVNNPKIAVLTNANGVMNIQALMKSEKSAANSDQEEAIKSVAAAPAGDSPSVPAFLLNSSLGVAISGGDVEVTNNQTGARYQLTGLELEGRNLGFNRTLTLKFVAPIKGSQADLKFQGDVTGNAKLYPVMTDRSLRGAKGQISVDASKLAIEYGKIFQKASSMPLKLEADLDSTDTEMLIKKLDVNIHDLVLSGKGSVSLQPSLKAKLEVNSSAWNLSKMSDLVPMLKAYGLKGTAQLNLGVNVEGNRNTAQGDLKVSDGEFFMKDMLKEPLKFQAQASFSENSLALSRLSLSGPDSDLQVQGNVMGFTAPKFNFAANGKSFNLDKVMVPTQKAAAFTLIQEAFAAEKEGLVNPMAAMMSGPMMSQASGTFNAKLGRLVAQGAEVKNIDVETLLMPGAILNVKKGVLQGFGGTAAMTGAFSLKSPRLDYKTNGKANGISAKDAIVSYFPKFKNTLEGKANADWNVAGNLYPAEARLDSITGTVKINAADGILRTADFKESIQGALSKVPFLKNAKVPDYEEGFKTLRADMKFQNGNITVDPMELVSKGRGFNIKGKSQISRNFEQDSYLDVYDPNGLLPKELNARPGQPAVPLHITGALTGPKTDYGYTVNRLASTVGKDAAKKAISKGLEKYLGGSEGGQGGDTAKKLTDQLKKKFKF